jgi:hypothetical protein
MRRTITLRVTEDQPVKGELRSDPCLSTCGPLGLARKGAGFFVVQAHKLEI